MFHCFFLRYFHKVTNSAPVLFGKMATFQPELNSGAVLHFATCLVLPFSFQSVHLLSIICKDFRWNGQLFSSGTFICLVWTLIVTVCCVACGYCCHSRCMNLISRMCASVKVSSDVQLILSYLTVFCSVEQGVDIHHIILALRYFHSFACFSRLTTMLSGNAWKTRTFAIFTLAFRSISETFIRRSLFSVTFSSCHGSDLTWQKLVVWTGTMSCTYGGSVMSTYRAIYTQFIW